MLQKLTNSPCYALAGGPYLPRLVVDKKMTSYPLAPRPTLPILDYTDLLGKTDEKRLGERAARAREFPEPPEPA